MIINYSLIQKRIKNISKKDGLGHFFVRIFYRHFKYYLYKTEQKSKTEHYFQNPNKLL